MQSLCELSTSKKHLLICLCYQIGQICLTSRQQLPALNVSILPAVNNHR